MVCVDGRERDWDLLELKERYCTASHELIARRMLEMRPPIVITVCDRDAFIGGEATSRRGRRICCVKRRQFGERCIRPGLPMCETLDAETGLESVRCWPIHELGWKREIIRSEIAEF